MSRTTYVAFGDVPSLHSPGHPLVPMPPDDAEAAGRAAFMVKRLSGRSPAAAIGEVGLHSWPPLLLIARERPNPELLEALRRQGASLIVTEGDLERLFELPVGRRLLASSEWFSARMPTVSAPDVVQMLASSTRTGLIHVSCPHVRPVQPGPWRDAISECARGSSCPGFQGRVVLDRGQVVHAETPQARGIEALAILFALERATLRLHEVFIQPSHRTIGTSTPETLLTVATRIDERSRDLPIPSNAAEPSMSATAPEDWLEPGDLALAVHADRGGGVLAAAGRGDGESLAATSALCAEAWARSADALGLGSVRSWIRIGGGGRAIFGKLGPNGARLGVSRGGGHSGFRHLARFEQTVDEGPP